jgi:hypothetical protein
LTSKATETWRINGQNTEVVDKCNYLSMMLESTGGWHKQKILPKTIGYQVLVAIEKCILVTPNINTNVGDVGEYIQNGT